MQLVENFIVFFSSLLSKIFDSKWVNFDHPSIQKRTCTFPYLCAQNRKVHKIEDRLKIFM